MSQGDNMNGVRKGIWDDPAEFVWAIGDKGRKMILANFLMHSHFPSEIATAFSQGVYHDKLTAQFGESFTCNAHDIVNAYLYMTERKNVEWQQTFNEETRGVWENDFVKRMEVLKWVEELRKGEF